MWALTGKTVQFSVAVKIDVNNVDYREAMSQATFRTRDWRTADHEIVKTLSLMSFVHGVLWDIPAVSGFMRPLTADRLSKSHIHVLSLLEGRRNAKKARAKGICDSCVTRAAASVNPVCVAVIDRVFHVTK